MWRRKKTSHVRESAQEREHRIRRREVSGCIRCGKEILPGHQLMVCGERFERWTICMRCYGSGPNQCTTPMYRETVLWEVDPGPAIASCATVAAALAATLEVYSDRPCLGFPLTNNTSHLVQSNGTGKTSLIDYQWLSYREVLIHATDLGAGLRTALLESNLDAAVDVQGYISTSTCSPSPNTTAPTTKAQNPRNLTVLLYAEASVEWYLMQYGCLLQRLLIIPVLDGTPEHQLAAIFERCSPGIVITTTSKFKKVKEAISHKPTEDANTRLPPRIVIIATSTKPPYPYKDSDADITSTTSSVSLPRDILRTSDIAMMGKCAIRQNAKTVFTQLNLQHIKEDTDMPIMLMPTSGSSGNPKLIMVTDRMIARQFVAPSFGVRTVMYSFQPIRQSFDTLIKGGQLGLWSGDLGALHHDMAVLRPTHFGSTPVFWIAQLQQFNADVRNAIENMPTNATTETDEDVRSQVVKKWKEKRLLGNRCKMVLIGGAPSSEELKTWIWEVFGATVVDGYGTSETGAIASNTVVSATSNLQLIDAPEMGYSSSDTPYPRGEIVAFSDRLTPGYYNDPAANEKAFITIGGKRYFRTGDIGMLVDGKLNVIDRKSALFKLANGVFVAPAPLETLFGQSILIKQAFVHASSGARAVSVVVVLTDAGVEACTHKAGSKIIMDPQPIIKECARLASSADRKGYEIPQKAVLTTEEWTIENSCLTSSLKVCRPVLLKIFSNELNVISLDNGSKEDTRHNKTPGVKEEFAASQGNDDQEDGLSAGLKQVLRETIPSFDSNDDVSSHGHHTLYSLGLDSLSMAVIRTALQSRFAIDIPLTRLAGATLWELNTAVLGGGVHSLPDREDGTESLQAEADAVRNSWRTNSIGAENNRDNGHISVAASHGVRALLTGVTGFVGAFLLDELLRRSANMHVICLVREKNHESAITRIQSTLQRYNLKCNPTRWSAIVGDLAEAKLGLPEETWDELVNVVDAVYHAGAIVNASLPLAAIRATNITGTKIVVELCVAANAVLHHISTASVLAGSGITNETFAVPPPTKHGTAYAKSKWVAEQVVGYGVTDLGLRARIYRLGTMASHSITGACNPNDTFTRIVEGIIALKACSYEDDAPLPKGFYLSPIDWAVDAVYKFASKPFPKLENVQSLKQKLATQKEVAEVVEVLHILTDNFTPTALVLNAIIKHGIPLIALTTKEFKTKIATVVETNSMYTFRDVLNAKMGNSAASRSHSLSSASAQKYAKQCPVVGEEALLRMISFLTSAKRLTNDVMT